MMKTNTLVSVVVPSYNVEKYLKRCIKSLVNQTYTSIEIIIVNDGSLDGTGSIAAELAKNDKRIIVLNKENGGLSDARNYGLAHSNGKYVLFVDSDDYIELDSIRIMTEECEINNLDVLRSGYKKVFDDGRVWHNDLIKRVGGVMKGIDYFYEAVSSNTYYAMAWCGLYLRSFLINNNLYFKKGIYHEDALWTPQVLIKADRVGYLDYEFYNYCIRDDSITCLKNRMERGIDIIESTYYLSENYIFSNKYQTMWNDFLTRTYFSGVNTGDLIASEYRSKLSKEFVFVHGLNKKNFIRTLLFVISYDLYAFFDRLYRKMKDVN